MGRSSYHMHPAVQGEAEDIRATESEGRGRAIRSVSKFRLSFLLSKPGMLAGLFVFLAVLQSGCGAGGYAGGGITSLTASVITLDAGQTTQVGASGSNSLPLQWTLSGMDCANDACGTLSSATGTTITYIAPPWLGAPKQATLDAKVPGTSSERTVAISVNPAPAITGNPPSATVGVPYSFTFATTGGTAPSKLTLQSGTLPAGLTFDPVTRIVSGTPTMTGTSSFVLQFVDSSDVPYTVTASETISVGTSSSAPGLVVLSGNPPVGVVGSAYSTMLQASGGTSPYLWRVIAGSLPDGLTLDSATGAISGKPAKAGNSSFTAQVTDANGNTASGAFSVTVVNAPASPVITTGTLQNGTVNVPYMASISAAGGTAPYTCALMSGMPPAGLVLNANCTLTGTPTTAATSTFVVKVMDSATSPQSGTGSITVTINPVQNLTVTSPVSATVGTPYTGVIGAGNGTAPYLCKLVSGTLPAGLVLGANCVITGTPTSPGNSTIGVQVTDSGNPQQTITAPVTIMVNPAQVGLTIGTLPNGTTGLPYTANVMVTGGTAPYTCVLASGTLPVGLTLGQNCSVTGTPTVAGTSSVMVRATDSGNPALTATASQTITINSGALLTISSPPAAMVNTPYTGTVAVTGGTAPYRCSLIGGNLLAGLTLNTNCTITGTPTSAGTQTVTVQATDSSSPARTSSGTVTVTVNPATTTLTIGNPLAATVSTPYTGTIPVSGGTAPYTCALASGTAPTGLTLNANCTVTGTPTAIGTTTLQVTATDSTTPTATTKTGPVTITVQQALPVTFTGSLPNAIVNQAYTQTLAASGGVGPYTYTLTSGTLPNGISLSSAGVLSGTPTKVGASSFTVTATDSQGTPASASLPLVLLVTYPPTANDTLLTGPFAFLFQGYDDVAAGVLAYQTATAGSIVADGNGVITSGEQDSNHQLSNPTGNTITTRNVIGSYTVGSDRRGSLTLTPLNADGTVGTTQTYAIALRAPVAPATVAASGSLTEFDSDQAVGTKGSGTLLAQTATAMSAGLNGSYAFGLSGDTPCLPSCTTGISAGPVATVGQFNAAANTITGGAADTNIASTAIANSALSGSYTATDSYGRVQLNLASARLAGVPYPTDFAAYVVDAGHVILLSTDKHSSYILQAGTATLQTQANFSNASLSAGYVGRENAAVNPGLLNTTLSNVLNLSTATIFRGTANGNGTCTTTNVDLSGTSTVTSRLSGIVNAPLITALLGSYQSLGNSNCTVAANGRAVMEYPSSNAVLTLTLQGFGLPATPASRVVYLAAPNQGYFLETGYAALGMLEAQSGGSHGNADLNGSYVYGSTPAATLASTNSSGVINADGAGNSNSTLDRNVGVGTINVLQLGVQTSATYNVTDTTAGRFLLSTGEVIYEIVPGRFALLQPELTNTSPYVALLF